MKYLGFNGGLIVHTVDHAVKGPDYIHGYDADGKLIVAYEGITAFELFDYDGIFLTPEECLSESCNTVKHVGGQLCRADGTAINGDYVISQGTTGKGLCLWHYRIWNSGFAECFGRWQCVTTITPDHNTSNNIYYSEQYTCDYPFTKPFREPHELIRMASSGNASIIEVQASGAYTNKFGFRLHYATNKWETESLDVWAFLYAAGYLEE